MVAQHKEECMALFFLQVLTKIFGEGEHGMSIVLMAGRRGMYGSFVRDLFRSRSRSESV